MNEHNSKGDIGTETFISLNGHIDFHVKVLPKWKGREKEYHRDYMRKYRKRKKRELKGLKGFYEEKRLVHPTSEEADVMAKVRDGAVTFTGVSFGQVKADGKVNVQYGFKNSK